MPNRRRSNSSGRIGFVSDRRRLNVAITRPRRGLIVVGNARTLASNADWKTWLLFVQKVKAIIPASEFLH